MRKMPSEMCAKERKCAALWRAKAKRGLFEIENMTIHTNTTKALNTLRGNSRTYYTGRNFELFCLRKKSCVVKGTQKESQPKSTRTSLRVCVVSHYLRCLSSLSLFISLAQTREEQERRLFGGRGTKAKPAAHSVVAFRTRRKRNKIDFPGDGISDLGKRERETDELFL